MLRGGAIHSNSMKPIILATALAPLVSVVVAACMMPGVQGATTTVSAADIQAHVQEATDANAMTQLDTMRKSAARGGMAEARHFAGTVSMLYDMGTVARGKVDGPSLLHEADGYLESAAQGLPAEMPE